MSSVQSALGRLRPVALLQSLRDIAMRRGQQRELDLRQLRRHARSRAEVRPDELAELARRIGLDADLAVIRRAGRHVRHLDATALHVVLPAVIDAAQPAFLIAAEEKIRATMRARRLDQPDAASRITEGEEIFAEHAHPQGRAIGLRQLARQRHRQPVAPEVLAHRRAGAGARQNFVVGRGQHRAKFTSKNSNSGTEPEFVDIVAAHGGGR